MDPDGIVAFTQDMSNVVPPFGRRFVFLGFSPAVVGRFSAFSLYSTRPDGFWINRIHFYSASTFNMPSETIAAANYAEFVPRSYSPDFGIATTQDLGLHVATEDCAASAGVDQLFSISAGIGSEERMSMPFWVPTIAGGSVAGGITIINTTVNASLSITFDLSLGF